MSRLRTVAAVLAGGLAVACGTDTSPTGPEQSPSPSFRTENSPEGPGALVFHNEIGFFVSFPAPDGSFLVAVGLTPSDLVDLCTGVSEPVGEALETFVIRPDGSFKELFKAKKVGLLLFPGDTEDICSAGPVAAGTGNYTLTDNDFIGSGRRTNSFGFRIRGNVTDEGGEKHHVLVVVKMLFNGNFGLKENVQSVEVN